MLPYDAVLFDLDGTLFDAEEGILSSFRKALAALDCDPGESFPFREVIGPPLLDSFEKLLGLSHEQALEGVLVYKEDFDARGRHLYSVYPGIRRILLTLRSQGIYTAVATSKPESLTRKILKDYHMTGLFDAIVGEGDANAKAGKAALIARALPKNCRRAAMVGDRRFDMEGARANGITGIGAAYGYGTRQELFQAGASCCAGTTEELYGILCGEAKPVGGFFLSVEGPDGCGKTTQIEFLHRELVKLGYEVVRTREPGGCPISEKIREIILDRDNAEMCGTCEALLYAASRAQHVHQVIRPGVEAGKLVLCDRFVDSSVAYQGGARGLGIPLIQQINDPAVDGLMPHATLYLSVDASTALKRRYSASVPDRLEAEAESFHIRVQQAYEHLLATDPGRFLVVDASQPLEQVSRDARKAVLDRLCPEEE